MRTTNEIQNTESTEYIARADAKSAEALKAALKADAQKYATFKKEMREVQKFSVESAVIGRELGLSFETYPLPAVHDLAEAHFNQHYRKALEMSYQVFQWLISAARKLPEKIRTMEDVLPALQLNLFASNLLEMPERAAPQEAHDTTPTVSVFKWLGRVRVNLEKTFADVDHWDPDTRNDVRTEIEKTEKWLADWKTKILHKPSCATMPRKFHLPKTKAVPVR